MAWSARRGNKTSSLQLSPVSVTRTPTENQHSYQPVGDDQYSNYSSFEKNFDRNTLPQTRPLASILSSWQWEFACWSLGTVCLAAMVTILAYFDGKPLEQWHSRIQITSIISALSQAAQSALMVEVSSCIGQLKWPWLKKNRQMIDIRRFDDASRGPEGSLRLLLGAVARLEGLSVSLGAVVTVLMLAFGTFTQQTVRVLNKDVSEASALAELAYASAYESPPSEVGWSVEDEKQREGQMESRDLYMNKAIMSGLTADSHSLSEVAGSCISNRCTWPDVDSLAVCVALEDMSSKVIDRSNRTMRNAFSIEGVPISPPGDPFLNTYWMTSNYFGSDDLPAQQEAVPSTLSGIANVYVLYIDPCIVANTTGFWTNKVRPEYWRAYKASFRPCIQSLRSVFNITMNTTVHEERTDLEWQARTVPYTYPEFPDLTWSGPHWCDPRNTSLCISNGSLSAMGWEFNKVFTGSAFTLKDSNMVSSQNIAYLITDTLGSVPSICNITEYTSRLGYRGFSMRMQNIATAITNAMRTAESHAVILGTSYRTKPYIVVEFEWFAFPAALWVLATVFFFATVLGTKRGDVPIWKSNPLVLLRAMDEHNEMGRLRQVNDEGRDVGFELRCREQGWWLKQTTTTQDEAQNRGRAYCIFGL